MTVTARAFAPNLLSITADISGSVTVNKVPVLFPNRVVNNLNGINGAPLAPGMVAQVYGSSLATSTAEPGVIPLVKTFNGTRVLVGAFDAPFYYLSDGQLNVQLPTELAADKEYSIVVAANGAYTLPDSIFLAPATPGVVAFADKRLVAQHGDYTLITPESPGKPGEAITIYLVGMGATDPTVASAVPPQASPKTSAPPKTPDKANPHPPILSPYDPVTRKNTSDRRDDPKERRNTLLSVNDISMRFGARILFEDVTTTFLQPDAATPSPGPNGAGKSTFMKILTGEIEPSKGSVTRPKKGRHPAPGSVRVRCLPRAGHRHHGQRPAVGSACRSAKCSTPRIPIS